VVLTTCCCCCCTSSSYNGRDVCCQRHGEVGVRRDGTDGISHHRRPAPCWLLAKAGGTAPTTDPGRGTAAFVGHARRLILGEVERDGGEGCGGGDGGHAGGAGQHGARQEVGGDAAAVGARHGGRGRGRGGHGHGGVVVSALLVGGDEDGPVGGASACMPVCMHQRQRRRGARARGERRRRRRPDGWIIEWSFGPRHAPTFSFLIDHYPSLISYGKLSTYGFIIPTISAVRSRDK
jgi:hypothetical protein